MGSHICFLFKKKILVLLIVPSMNFMLKKKIMKIFEIQLILTTILKLLNSLAYWRNMIFLSLEELQLTFTNKIKNGKNLLICQRRTKNGVMSSIPLLLPVTQNLLVML